MVGWKAGKVRGSLVRGIDDLSLGELPSPPIVNAFDLTYVRQWDIIYYMHLTGLEPPPSLRKE